MAQLAVLASGLVLVPALAAQYGGQIHGVPASVTSLTPSRPPGAFIGGVPTHGNGHFGGNHGNMHFGYGHNRPGQLPAYGTYYPYYGAGYGYGGYGYSYPIDFSYSQPQPEQQPVVEEEPREALTMFDRGVYRGSEHPASSDSRYGEHYTDGRERSTVQPQPVQQPNQSASALEPEETTVLVFRDGHQIEIGNYAIVGVLLYDLSARAEHRAPKIQLAELDIPATVRVNEQNGVDFKLPRKK